MVNYSTNINKINSDGQQFHQYQQNKQINSDGQQFHQYQQNKQINSDGQQFHQYQQNKRPPITSNKTNDHLSLQTKQTTTYHFKQLNKEKTTMYDLFTSTVNHVPA
jgi:hypothetical protein